MVCPASSISLPAPLHVFSQADRAVIANRVSAINPTLLLFILYVSSVLSMRRACQCAAPKKVQKNFSALGESALCATIYGMKEYDLVMQAMPSEADREKLVALPYRIGLYVSHADVTGGWEAQDAEMQTLTTILQAYSEDFCKNEFVQGLLMQTLAGRAHWPRWTQALAEVPGECVAAIYDLRGALEPKQLSAFQEQMMDIALAVAQAYREDRQAATPESPGMLARLLGRATRENCFAHLNISLSERLALERLAEALDYS